MRKFERKLRNSLLFACKFPGEMEIACVHAGPAMKFFFAGKFSLKISLRRESPVVGSCCVSLIQQITLRHLARSVRQQRSKSGEPGNKLGSRYARMID